jgi:hypothetical protein
MAVAVRRVSGWEMRRLWCVEMMIRGGAWDEEEAG